MNLARFVSALADAGVAAEPREVAEALWLAQHLPPSGETESTGQDSPRTDRAGDVAPISELPDEEFEPTAAPAPNPRPSHPAQNQHPLHLPQQNGSTGTGAQSIMLPATDALPGKLTLGRALRFLKRQVPDTRRLVLDEELTASRIAEDGTWLPELRPVTDRWLDVALVVDAELSMQPWQPLVKELRAVLQNLGAFRDVRTWSLHSAASGRLGLSCGTTHSRRLRAPAELIDPTRRRLVLVVSDCVGAPWHNGAASDLLFRWAQTMPVAILQPLPQRMWQRTGLRPVGGRLSSSRAGADNAHLRFIPHQRRRKPNPSGTPVPILQIEPEWLRPWAGLVGSDTGGSMDSAVTFTVPAAGPTPAEPARLAPRRPVDHVKAFRGGATADAFRLASYLTAVPLNLAIMRLVQRTMLPASRPSHLAEVLLSGMLRTASGGADTRYEFVEGVREELAGHLARSDARRLRSELSRFFADRLGLSVREFRAATSGPAETGQGGSIGTGPAFGSLPAALLARLGGRFRELVELFEVDGPQLSLQNNAPLPERAEELVMAADQLLASVWAELYGPDDQPAPKHFSGDGEGEPRSGNELAAVAEAIRLYRRALAVGGQQPRPLAGLVRTLRIRHALTDAQADLQEALAIGAEALSIAAEWRDLACEVSLCVDLAELRLARFDRRGSTIDLNEGVRLLLRASDLTEPGDPARQERYTALARAFRLRFDRTGTLSDLDEAVSMYQQAVAFASSGEQPRLLTDLAGTLRTRFDFLRSPIDLGEALDAQRKAVAAATDDAERWRFLVGLADLLRTRFEMRGSQHDLDEALNLYRQAVSIAPPGADRLQSLSALSSAAATRFLHTGDTADLDEAVELNAYAAETSRVGDPAHAGSLFAMSRLLLTRFGRSGDADDVNRAVRASRRALETTPPYHPDHAAYLEQLGIATRTRFDNEGDPLDLVEAIDAYRRAADATPADEPTCRARYLTELGESLRLRSEDSAGHVDLGAAIAALREATELSPREDPAFLHRLLLLTSLRILAGLPLDEARDETRTTIDLHEGLLGEDHPSTLKARVDLGSTLLRAGHLVQAEHELAAARAALTRTLGPDDPAALAARFQHASALTGLNRRAEARKELTEVLESQIRTLGTDHPDTIETRATLANWR
ncbi:tetratricopeptide repeat protein [Saccharopolyspora spinosa]|uniref:Tetratricopeptide repeat protein n=1 Tax=Saccharopolyspora spinosa TaxID=60894 RepID=A0A2N3Y6P5_SACSN|nr:tetratricopeptide repeat protein [Saccharopolyspora spinosa]PKW18599.1 tetratricopeptide repeat protein [Saccharopolyspora spinosa]